MAIKKKDYRSFKRHTFAEAFQSLVERRGDPGIQKRLVLWTQWEKIMGSPIIDLGFPIETKGKNIIMGAQNSMAMQELSMLAPTILHRANTFLGERLFTKVVFMQVNEPKAQRIGTPPASPVLPESGMPTPPKNFGHKLDDFSDDSLVSQCYRALYSAYFPQDSDE